VIADAIWHWEVATADCQNAKLPYLILHNKDQESRIEIQVERWRSYTTIFSYLLKWMIS